MAFEIEFYSSKDGREPVAEFLDSLDSKMSAKLVGLMEILEEEGQNYVCPTRNILRMVFLNFAVNKEVISQE